MDPVIALTRDLVAIDSVNPSLVAGAAGEARVAECAASRLRAAGLDVELQPVLDGRPNVVGVLEGRSPGRSLMLCGHLDTVGVEGMEAPFSPVERDGRLYGRGSQDMKGGVAAIVDAARVLAAGGFDSGRLIVAAVVDEEYASAGADALVTRWRADAAVVTEPTDLQIAVAHKGFAWFEIETRGRAAHGSRPAEGRDAILFMGRVLQRLDAMNRALEAGPPHALLGCASLHASTVHGGREWSTYPDRCTLRIERRTLPGERDEDVLTAIAAAIEDLRRRNPELEASARLVFARPPYELPATHAVATALAAAAGKTTFSGMSFWTDAAVLGAAGIPSILYGPGGAGLHGIEEYVNVADVVACRDALVALARAWCRA